MGNCVIRTLKPFMSTRVLLKEKEVINQKRIEPSLFPLPKFASVYVTCIIVILKINKIKIVTLSPIFTTEAFYQFSATICLTARTFPGKKKILLFF